MKEFHVYNDIQQRTNGEIYLGVVGPVRTGKSTFIRRFMEELVIPHMEEGPDKERTRDELPQAASGKSIMTTEPKFIPTEAANVSMEDGARIKIRLVDCVGFMVPGAMGYQEDEKERLVHTPWSEQDIPFTRAAETGTRKVIEEHSTVGIIVTTDGTVTDLPESAYVQAEEKTVEALKERGKPFVIVLNTAEPESERARSLAKEKEEKYSVTAAALNCAKMTSEDIRNLMKNILMEFPVSQIDYEIPQWIQMLDIKNPLKQEMIRFAREILNSIETVKDAGKALDIRPFDACRRFSLGEADLATGRLTYEIAVKDEIYFSIISEYAGLKVENEHQLISILKEYASSRVQYGRVLSALESVKQTGYGVIAPLRDEISLDEPVVVRHGNRYGVKMKAAAPSVHMIRSMVETEIAPIVGSEKQAGDLVEYIQSAGKQGIDGIWNTSIFGKSIEQIVEDGMSAKIGQMTEGCRQKLQDALEKIINDSNGGMICIIV